MPIAACSSPSSSSLYSSTAIDIDISDVPLPDDPGQRLLALATALASESPTGVFLARPAAKIRLQTAINELEARAAPPGAPGRARLRGDWTLVATASLLPSDLRRRFTNDDGGAVGGTPLGPLQRALRKTVAVTQRIRGDGPGDGIAAPITRVDNVIEYAPPDTLADLLPEGGPLRGLLGGVDVNPLRVKRGKVVLVHKAEVESVAPVLRTKIAWTSTVVNVAGSSSQYFDPEGADLFGVNNPLGEFINAGTFDTPYVDRNVRVSRTRGPVSEQLRVFVRSDGSLPEEGGTATPSDGEEDGGGGEGDGPRAPEVADAAPAGNVGDVGDATDAVTARVQDAEEDDLVVPDAEEDDLVGSGRAPADAAAPVSADSAGADATGPGDVLADVQDSVDKIVEGVQDAAVPDTGGAGDGEKKDDGAAKKK